MMATYYARYVDIQDLSKSLESDDQKYYLHRRKLATLNIFIQVLSLKLPQAGTASNYSTSQQLVFKVIVSK
jgi:hypothetical protein